MMNSFGGNSTLYRSHNEAKEEIPRVLLVQFKNGTLTSYGKKKIAFKCYKNAKRNTSCFQQRILVAKTDSMCYVGSNFETEMSKITSSVLKLFVVNKRDGSISLYDVDFFTLKPQTKCPVIIEKKDENKSYGEKSSDLTLAFGSKSQQKILNTRKTYGVSAATSDDILAIPDVDYLETVNLAAQNNAPSAIPPQNNSATSVDEVYYLDDIISSEELDALTSEAENFLDVKPETVKEWDRENKYTPFIIYFLERNMGPMNSNMAKLLCYLHYMFCFLRSGFADWKKKDPVPNVPEPFKQKLISSFTVNKRMPQRLKDKLLAYATVLGLKLCNYVLPFNLFSSSAKAPLTRMTSVAHALGCYIYENKVNGMKTVELKLPLYKHQALSRKKKKP